MNYVNMLRNSINDFGHRVYDYCYGSISDDDFSKSLDKIERLLDEAGTFKNKFETDDIIEIKRDEDSSTSSIIVGREKAFKTNFLKLTELMKEVSQNFLLIDHYFTEKKERNDTLVLRAAVLKKRKITIERYDSNFLLPRTTLINFNEEKNKMGVIVEKTIRPTKRFIEKTLKASQALTGKKTNVIAFTLFTLWSFKMISPFKAISLTATSYAAENLAANEDIANKKTTKVALASIGFWGLNAISLPFAILLTGGAGAFEYGLDKLRNL